MDIANKTVWQVAAGDTNRDYAQLCLDFGVILNGPGDIGDLTQERLAWDHVSSRKRSDLERFSKAIKAGDLIVLRVGTSTVCGVGEVVGRYSWEPGFEDVDGWDLQHVRRVKWLWTEPKSFDAYSMKFGDTTQPLSGGPVLEWLASSEFQVPQESVSLPPLPDPGKMLKFHTIAEFLFDRGVASDSIHSLESQIGELSRIASWYDRTEGPSESETVAYLTVPLLRALGWTPQRMAVEWNRVDLALFEALPRVDDTLCVVVEAKKKGMSCLTARSQAQEYSIGKERCNRLVVTDGLRYGVYVRPDGGDWADGEFRLHAYLNLLLLRDQYSIYGAAGASEALWSMTPEWGRRAGESRLKVGSEQD